MNKKMGSTTKLVMDTITNLRNRTLNWYWSLAKGIVWYSLKLFCCLLLLCNILTLFILAVLHEGSMLPQPEDIINDESTFLSSGKMSQSFFWFKTKLAKAITNSFWDPWKRKVNDYYSRVNSHNKAMGLWALNYVRTEKMIKKETQSDEQEQDGNSSNTNDKKCRKQDITPRVWINMAAITVFSGYLRRVNAIQL